MTISNSPSRSPALSAENLAKTYVVRDGFLRERHFRAVTGVSFEVEVGTTLAIVGESGCGKSTLGRLILRLNDATSGTLALLGARIDHLTQREFRRHRSQIQMVFQDPFASFDPRMRVSASIREVVAQHTHSNSGEIDEVADALVRSVGLDPVLARHFPRQLSGGQLQRFSIARALAPKPEVIFLDEPTSALDVAVRGQIVNLLLERQEHVGLTYLLVSHDLQVVSFMADEIAVMYLGEFVEVASRDDLFNRPLHPYTRGLLGAAAMDPRAGTSESVAIVRLAGELQQDDADLPGCRLMPRCPFAKPDCAQPQVLRKVAPGHYVRCWRALDIT